MYEPITEPGRSVTIGRVLLTLCAGEFFGPIFRDFSASHLLHPEWVGHARLHMMWLLGFMGVSGVVNLYLIWFTRPLRMIHLWIVAAWEGALILGFWIAVALVPVYDGLIVVPGYHIAILGIDENVFAFGVFTAILGAAVFFLRSGGKAVGRQAEESAS